MIPIPDFLKEYIPEAEKLISENAIREIEFSAATYQIKVFDPKLSQDCWAFIQLNPQGILQDAFCSFGEEEQTEGCAHLAAALLRIYRDPIHPLHERFEKSFWNKLCHIFFEHFGERPKRLKKEKNEIFFGAHLQFSFDNATGEKQFFDI